QHVLADLRGRRTSIVLAAFTIILLGLYTLVRSKLFWYLDPIFPAYALFAAGGAEWLTRRRGLLPVAAAAALAVVAIWAGPNSVRVLPLGALIGLTALVAMAAAAGLALRGRTE